MAKIINKKVIEICNGDLKRLCETHRTSVPKVAEALKLNQDHLYKFDRGEKTIRLEVWNDITKYLIDRNRKTS